MKIGIVVSEFNYRDHWVNHENYEQVLVSTLATLGCCGRTGIEGGVMNENRNRCE
jgi:hypothetical protein